MTKELLEKINKIKERVELERKEMENKFDDIIELMVETGKNRIDHYTLLLPYILEQRKDAIDIGFKEFIRYSDNEYQAKKEVRTIVANLIKHGKYDEFIEFYVDNVAPNYISDDSYSNSDIGLDIYTLNLK